MMKNKKFYILVEGSFDVKFYSQIFDNNKTIIKPCNGKETVIDVYNKLNKDNLIESIDVIFILDKDYDFYLDSNIKSEKVFYTDFHDLDVVLIECGAFEKFIDFDCNKGKLKEFKALNNIEDLKQFIFSSARKIGYLRMISLRDKYNLTFQNIEFKNFINRNTLSINVNNLIAELKNKSQRLDIDSNEIMYKLQELETNKDLQHIESGHDILNILAIAMKKVFATNSSNAYCHDTIQDKMLYGCDVNMFKQTNLYKDIKSFCSKNNKQCVIKD